VSENESVIGMIILALVCMFAMGASCVACENSTNCAKACFDSKGGRMKSYSERHEAGGAVPVCECATVEPK
jgi:hypothetical protein